MMNPYADRTYRELLHAVEQLLTSASDDLGLHIAVTPMSCDLAAAIRQALIDAALEDAWDGDEATYGLTGED